MDLKKIYIVMVLLIEEGGGGGGAEWGYVNIMIGFFMWFY